MDGTADELAEELRTLTRQLKDQLLRHAGQGAWAAPGGPTARNAIAEPEADRIDDRIDDGIADGPDEPFALTAPAPPPAVAPPPPAAPAAALFTPPPALLTRKPLAQIRDELGECTRCKLHATRKTIVFGVGTADTPLMFVGEAPGEQEDRRGEPFVGPAGQLLDKMIEAMGWTRDSVYIANTTKCRPPNNRNPQPDELSQCMPFLDQQIASIAPRIIVALGRPAANQLLERDVPISALRGKFHDFPRSLGGAQLKIMPTFHPAYLLRDPSKKRLAWDDLKLVMTELERLGIATPKPRA
ncbi:MAG TPA: uracil-DNA glycosylase [Kofleriaceae bacterium]|nr:uracil-DNA glycosylase [Kofleriaceae bacterium]